MNYSQWGLILDILGVVILFFWGLPSKIKPLFEPRFIPDNPNEKLPEEIDKERKDRIVKIMARIGLGLIILGFIFQFIGTLNVRDTFPSQATYKPNGDKSNDK